MSDEITPTDAPEVTADPTGVMDAMVGDLDEVIFDDPLGDEPIVPEGTDEDLSESVNTDAPDTKPETGDEPDTKVDTDDDALATLLKETGLDKTYATPELALRALPAARAELGRREQEVQQYQQVNAQLAEMVRRQQPVEQQPGNGLDQDALDDLLGDPTPEKFQEVLSRAGYVTKSDFENGMKSVQAIRSKDEIRDLADDFSAFDDFKDVGNHIRTTGQLPPKGTNKAWDTIWEMTDQFPSLKQASVRDLIGVFNRSATRSGKPGVPPVPPHKKAAATTTSADRTSAGSSSPGGLPSNWNSLSADQQQNVLTKLGFFG